MLLYVCKTSSPLPWWSNVITSLGPGPFFFVFFFVLEMDPFQLLEICGRAVEVDWKCLHHRFFQFLIALLHSPSASLFYFIFIFLIPLNVESVCKAGVGSTLTYDTYVRPWADVWRIILRTSKFIPKSNSRTRYYCIIFCKNSNIVDYEWMLIT